LNENIKMVQLEKKHQRILNEDAAATKHELEQNVKYLNTWISEMENEVCDLKCETKTALHTAGKNKDLANRRIVMMKDLKSKIGKLKDSLADESHELFAAPLERLIALCLEIKRQRTVGRKEGSGKFVLLICKLLVNGTPPSAIPGNIQSVSESVTGVSVSHNPSVNFVRQCRVVEQNLNEMLAAYRLGKEMKWNQIFIDGTSRRQTAFQNLVMGMENGVLFESSIASSCIFLENETLEQQVEGILNKVSSFTLMQMLFVLSTYINLLYLFYKLEEMQAFL